MHNNAGIYAVDRRTGATLWSIDVGFGAYSAYLDASRKHVTIFQDYDPVAKKYVQRISHIRMADGKVMWKKEGIGGDQNIWMKRAKGALIVYTDASVPNAEGKLIALDPASGKQKWSKKMQGEYRIVSDDERDAAVLVIQAGTLQALNPANGKLLWEVESDALTNPYEAVIAPKANPLEYDSEDAKSASTRWMQIGSELLYIDTNKGTVKAKYRMEDDQQVWLLKDASLLIQRPKAGFEQEEMPPYETDYYDAISGKYLWTVQGRASRAVFEDDRVYMSVDGIPTAVNKRDGTIVWQAATTGYGSRLSNMQTGDMLPIGDKLIVPSGEDLLLLNKSDGKLLNRIQDVRFGYPDLRESDATNGFLNTDGQYLYIGSSNGYFSKLKLDAIK